MKIIPSNVPVFIQDIKESENKRYSIAKLKIFYVGETEDHRLFTKNFAEKVIKSLPLTPIVGFYSEEDKDFIGHNSTQYIYGVVPETSEITFEKEEETDRTYAITDVILYTEREDNIGEVAKKIVGKQHSLELDRKTLKYKINTDNQGNFLNIEFTDGSFIGLSVLGDNETPAFEGSMFFTKMDENGLDFITEYKSNLDNFLKFLNNNGGNIKVFNSKEFFEKVGDFATRTMQEFQNEIYKALDEMGIYGYICENTEEYAVISSWGDGAPSYIRYAISQDEEGKVSLTEPVSVKARFLTDEQIQALDNVSVSSSMSSEDPKGDNNEPEDPEDLKILKILMTHIKKKKTKTENVH